ncbi:MAG: hypothetical protein QXE34_00325 [Candidatus Aenigmatarchaeota archaeon]|nr:hypothetical protein [Candidatus Aenigmarchaeota archaeon]
MKGLSTEYIFYSLIFLTFIIISVSIIKNISFKSYEVKEFRVNSNYFCLYMNDTEINKKDLKIIFYGFIKDSCNNFVSSLNQSLSKEDIKKIVENIDKDYSIVVVNSCNLETTNTKTIFINFEYLKPNQKFYLYKKEINDSDIIMCVL